ncbi:hypothetical protein HYU19_00625 [Candidatus Woesearchaeota archaeon]|nr:hypothetical protein [Candidatus Woesearchaeota archaeon]
MPPFDLESIAACYDAVFLDANVFAITDLPRRVRELQKATDLLHVADDMVRTREELAEMRHSLSRFPFYVTPYIHAELENALGVFSGSARYLGRNMARVLPHRQRYALRRGQERRENSKENGSDVKTRLQLKEDGEEDNADGQYRTNVLQLIRVAAEFSHLLQAFPVYRFNQAIPSVPQTKKTSPSEADASLVVALFDYAAKHPGNHAAVVSMDLDVVAAYHFIAHQESIPPTVTERTRTIWYAAKAAQVRELSVEDADRVLHG